MDVYLIQVSGREIPEVHREAGGKGPRFVTTPSNMVSILMQREDGEKRDMVGRKHGIKFKREIRCFCIVLQA